MDSARVDTLRSPSAPSGTFSASDFGVMSTNLSVDDALESTIATEPTLAPLAERAPYCADLVLEIAIMHLGLEETAALVSLHEDVRALNRR